MKNKIARERDLRINGRGCRAGGERYGQNFIIVIDIFNFSFRELKPKKVTSGVGMYVT